MNQLQNMTIKYKPFSNSENVTFDESLENKSIELHPLKKWIETLKTSIKKIPIVTATRQLRNKKIIGLILLTVLLMFYMIWENNLENNVLPRGVMRFSSNVPGMKGYVVWSEKCRMRDINSETPRGLQNFQYTGRVSWASSNGFAKIKFDDMKRRYEISAYSDISLFWDNPLYCCYEELQANFFNDSVSFSNCTKFVGRVLLPSTIYNVLVRCKGTSYNNHCSTLTMLPERKEIQTRIRHWKKRAGQKPLSVLMLGVNDISITDLLHRMPRTTQLLFENEWFGMSGYSNMAVNTFSNLMAILTGYNESTASARCHITRKEETLDECPFLWQAFQERGYVTVYADDLHIPNVFDQMKTGFVNTPPDYLLRSFMLDMKQKHSEKKRNKTCCYRHQPNPFFVYDYAVEMVDRFRNDPYLGIFWSGGFSENNARGFPEMDIKLHKYLTTFEKLNVFKNSIVFFFSNNVEQFGSQQNTISSYLEGQKPFLYISVPSWLYNAQPEIINALAVNRNRLTSPLDLHMTLQHVLKLSGRITHLKSVEDCPSCQTLLKFIDDNRSCSEAGIDEEACRCDPYQLTDENTDVVQKIGYFTINFINNLLENASLTDQCEILSLNKVLRAEVLNNYWRSNTYKIYILAIPKNVIFSTTVKIIGEDQHMEVNGKINRLGSYVLDSYCISGSFAKKYCICKNSTAIIAD